MAWAWLGPADRPAVRTRPRICRCARLDAVGLLYPCFCTRAEIRAEVASSASAPHGPEGPLYPGICRALSAAERAARLAAGTPHALRFDARRAMTGTGPLTWHDAESGTVAAAPEQLGDVVLARKGISTSYHLAVVVDDAFQGITLVTRGADLFHATHIHRLLQAVLDLPTPGYHHHRLITGPDGKRLPQGSLPARVPQQAR